MITITDYTAHRVTGCHDCLEADLFHADTNWDPDSGEILDTVEPHFGRTPCDVCGGRDAGHRYHGTILTADTHTR